MKVTFIWSIVLSGAALVAAVLTDPKFGIQSSAQLHLSIEVTFLGCAFAMAGAAIGFRREHDRQLRRDRGLCVKCGYDLRASCSVCPECGHHIEMKNRDADKIGKRG